MIRFVTRNEGKFREVAAVFAAAHLPLDRLDMEKTEIQAERLEDVVAFAARDLARRVDGDFLVDDSGLFVDALGGFPGVYSHFVYRTLGCRGLLTLLKGEPNRKATFRAAFALRRGDAIRLFSGEVGGVVAAAVRGTGGFGFDPVFVPNGAIRTFAEMTVEEKNQLSHRAAAARQVVAYLKRER